MATDRGPPGASELCSSVALTGQWRGRVLLDCNREMASAIAAAMFEVQAAAVSDEDRSDALGELANIVGGNFKALLAPLESEIALPRVTRADPEPIRPDERIVAAVGLSCAGQVLRLRFVQGG
jgi:chemotaxis protein CheX